MNSGRKISIDKVIAEKQEHIIFWEAEYKRATRIMEASVGFIHALKKEIDELKKIKESGGKAPWDSAELPDMDITKPIK